MRAGKRVDSAGNVRGEHGGVAMYTVGQRKRLPASDSGPLYVLKLEPASNTVVIGNNEELFAGAFVATRLNWISYAGFCLKKKKSPRILEKVTATASSIV